MPLRKPHDHINIYTHTTESRAEARAYDVHCREPIILAYASFTRDTPLCRAGSFRREKTHYDDRALRAAD